MLKVGVNGIRSGKRWTIFILCLLTIPAASLIVAQTGASNLDELTARINGDPYDFQAYLERGLEYYNLGQYEEANHDFKRAIELAPQNSHAYFLKGLADLALNRLPSAIEDLDRALGLDPGNFEAYYQRGYVYYLLGDYQSAAADFTQAIVLGLDEMDAYGYRGDCFYYLGDYARAVEDYGSYIILNPSSAPAFCRRGDALRFLERFTEAMGDYSQAIAIDPLNAYAYDARGDIYYVQKQYQQAAADYGQAIFFGSQDPETYFFRGMAYYELGQYAMALEDYRSALNLDPDYDLAQQWHEYVLQLDEVDGATDEHDIWSEQESVEERRAQDEQEWETADSSWTDFWGEETSEEGNAAPPATNYDGFSLQQQKLLDEFGAPESFLIQFYGENALGEVEKLRCETWYYYDLRTSFSFVNGIFQNSRVLTELEGEVKSCQYRPESFRMGMTWEEVQAILGYRQSASLDSERLEKLAGIEENLSLYFAEQIILGFSEGGLKYVMTIPVQEEDEGGGE